MPSKIIVGAIKDGHVMGTPVFEEDKDGVRNIGIFRIILIP
jgi:hypothetical protein